MPLGCGWRVEALLVPTKMVAMLANLVAALMALDGIDSNVLASLRPGHRQAVYNDTMTSAKVAVSLGMAGICVCVCSLLVGYGALGSLPAIFQIPLHSASSAWYLYSHYTEAHYMRFWHIFFCLVFPATLLEVLVVAAARHAKKVSW